MKLSELIGLIDVRTGIVIWSQDFEEKMEYSSGSGLGRGLKETDRIYEKVKNWKVKWVEVQDDGQLHIEV